MTGRHRHPTLWARLTAALTICRPGARASQRAGTAAHPPVFRGRAGGNGAPPPPTPWGGAPHPSHPQGAAGERLEPGSTVGTAYPAGEAARSHTGAAGHQHPARRDEPVETNPVGLRLRRCTRRAGHHRRSAA